MSYNSIHRRRRLNSSRDIDAFRQEAIELEPSRNASSWIYNHMSEDLYYFCVNLLNRVGKIVDTYGCAVSPGYMDDLRHMTEIRNSETGQVLAQIALKDELAIIVDFLADGYTPDTIVSELIDFYLDEANTNF